jgi:hypothetical protein
MAGRYGLNLRKIYDDDELTPGEYVQRGVAGAIEEFRRRGEQKKAEAEAERVERNTFTTSGFTAVPRGEERLAAMPQVQPRGIGQALGTLSSPEAGAGYDTAISRSGQTFRRPGVAMRESAESERRVSEKLRTEGPPLTFSQRQQLARPSMTQDQRIELENIRTGRAERIAKMNAAARTAAAAVSSGRGNSSTQLNALERLQSSYDAEVRSIRSSIADALRMYDSEGAAALRADLEEAIAASENNRALLSRLTGQGRAPKERAPAPAPRVGPRGR